MQSAPNEFKLVPTRADAASNGDTALDVMMPCAGGQQLSGVKAGGDYANPAILLGPDAPQTDYDDPAALR